MTEQERDQKRLDEKQKLGRIEDESLGALRLAGEEMIEEYRAASSSPTLDPAVSHAYACMSGAIDEFMAHVEEAILEGRLLNS